MATGPVFLEQPRRTMAKRPVQERVGDYAEVPLKVTEEHASTQARRCMGCGVAFCHHYCPLHNVIPEWNDLVARDDWARAADRLAATNNFPEFTGRLCPAPCEDACVLELSDEAVSIKEIELAIAEEAFARGTVVPKPPARRTGRVVAVVGSGPAGLAAAQELARAGHSVTVFERADRLGGLLRYGIPDYKMDKALIDRRLALLVAEGVCFEVGCEVGVDLALDELHADAVVLAIGAESPRDLDVPGRHLDGVGFAMPYLVQQNRRVAGLEVREPVVTARGRHVVIIGGGDTASDCLGNAHRELAASVRELSIYPEPPSTELGATRWPAAPVILSMTPAHHEGGTRQWQVQVTAFLGSDRVEAVEVVRVHVEGSGPTRTVRPIAGTESRLPCDLALLAIGFEGVTRSALTMGRAFGTQGALAPDGTGATEGPLVIAAGDAVTGAALVVTAIADGRRAASAVETHFRERMTTRRDADADRAWDALRHG
jgi:glutamate synthase (NADPH) small chain